MSVPAEYADWKSFSTLADLARHLTALADLLPANTSITFVDEMGTVPLAQVVVGVTPERRLIVMVR
jgi:hypothetical protein